MADVCFFENDEPSVEDACFQEGNRDRRLERGLARICGVRNDCDERPICVTSWNAHNDSGN